MNPKDPEKLLKFEEIDDKVSFSEGHARPFPETLSKKLGEQYETTLKELVKKFENTKVLNAFDSFLQKPEALIDSGAIDHLKEQKNLLQKAIHEDAKQLMIDPSFELETKLLQEEENYMLLITKLFDLESKVEYLDPEHRAATLELLIEDLRREKDFIDQYKHMFATTDPKHN